MAIETPITDGYAVIQDLSTSGRDKLSSLKEMPLSRGDKLGPYEILAQIGEGGMGVAMPRAPLPNVMPASSIALRASPRP